MKPYLDRLPKGSRLLDGGCGTGEWTLYFQQKGFDVCGLDISRTTVEKLKSYFPDSRFVVGDIRKTDFPDNTFDAYYSWGAFEHFEIGLGPCLDEAYRVLKPGGWLFISVPLHNGRLVRKERKPLSVWDED